MAEIQRFQGAAEASWPAVWWPGGVGEVVAAVEPDVVVAVVEDGVEHVNGFPHCGRDDACAVLGVTVGDPGAGGGVGAAEGRGRLPAISRWGYAIATRDGE